VDSKIADEQEYVPSIISFNKVIVDDVLCRCCKWLNCLNDGYVFSQSCIKISDKVFQYINASDRPLVFLELHQFLEQT